MAGSTIKVGMDVGDVKAAGAELLKQLNSQVDATLQLAEAQVKYNKEGTQVGSVLKGITDAGERYTLVIKQTAAGYELVNAQVLKAKASFNDIAKAQREAAQAAEEAAKARVRLAAQMENAGRRGLLEQQAEAARDAAAATRLNARLENAGRRGLASQQSEAAFDSARGPSRFDGGRGGNGSGGFLFGPPPIPPNGGSGIDEMTAKTEKSNKAAEKLFISWQGIVRLVEAQVIKRVINEVANAFTSAVDDAKKFSIAIAEIRTISQDMPMSVEKWRTEITKLSNQFGQSQTDVANAAYETLSNQIAKGPEAINFLATAMKFGAATVTSTTDSVNLLSSAIKSFNLPVQDAERISSIFFKTIDLGRVRAKDLADTFGRVGSIAQQAGVKLEEVAAAIATLTIRGIKPADSMTVLSNVLNQLIKPTDEMKKLFQQWGVASGEAAIATFGFEGVLAKLNEESQKGATRIGELFTNIRSLRGAFQLSGQGFSDYQSNLKKITTGQKEYNIAAKEILQSPGKQLEIATTKIKNLFTEDFGRGVVQGLVDFNKWAETASGAADGLERSVKLIVKTMTIGLSVLALWKAAVIANTVAGVGWSVILQKLTYDAVALGRALAGAAPFLALFAAGYVAGQAIQSGNDIGRTSGQIDSELRAKQEERAAALRKKLEENGDPDQESVRKLKSSLDTRYQFLLNYSTNAVRVSNELKQRTIDQYKDITDAVKISSKTYFDSILNKMSELRKSASEAESLIKASLKVSQDLPRRNSGEIFSERMKYANDGPIHGDAGIGDRYAGNQKVELLENRITLLVAQAREKAKEGTKEAFEESRKLYDDVQKLMAQLFEAKTSAQKRAFDTNVQRGLQGPTSMVQDFQADPSGSVWKPQYEFVAKTVEFEETLNKLSKERLSTERQFRDLQRQRAVDAEAEIAREKERLRSLQQAFTAIEKIEVFSKEGKVKEEYKNDPARAAREFDEQAARIKALAGQEGFGTQYQVFQDLQKQRLALVQQVEAAIRAEQAASVQQDLIKNKESTQKLIDSSAAQMNAGRAKMTQGMEQLERDLGVIEERTLRPQLSRFGKIPGLDIELTSGGANMLSKWLGRPQETGFEKAEPDRQAALEALKAVREAQGAFNADKTSAKLDTLKQKLVELKDAARKYIETFTGKSADNISESGDTAFKTQGERIDNLDVGTLVSREGLGTTAAASAQLDKAKNSVSELDRKIKTLPGGIEFFAQGIQTNAPAINDSFTSFTTSALTLTNQIKALNDQLELASQLLPKIRGDRDSATLGPLDDVQGKKFGGPIRHFAFGGPVGGDRVPAYLSDDEFVMTGAATRSFAPLLKQMNAYPSRAGGSGSSVTNVGDININVNGGDTSAKTINEIGVGLRRAIARGTVKLHG